MSNKEGLALVAAFIVLFLVAYNSDQKHHAVKKMYPEISSHETVDTQIVSVKKINGDYFFRTVSVKKWERCEVNKDNKQIFLTMKGKIWVQNPRLLERKDRMVTGIYAVPR